MSPHPSHASNRPAHRLGRRDLLRRVFVGAPAIAGLLAACSAPAPSSAPPAPAAAAPPAAASGSQATAAPAAAASAPKRGGTLTIAVSEEWRVLDPPTYANIGDRQVYYSIFNTLVAADEQSNIVPELAKSWQVSPDALTWTFNLVSGVKFHDGTDFNAQAVKFNLDRVLDAATASRFRSELADIQEIQAPNEATVKIVLKQPFTPLLAWLTDAPGMISSPTAIQKWGKDYASHPVGTGPFAFVEQVKGDHVTLKRNDSYWQPGLPYLDQVIFKPIPDATVRAAALRTKSVDIADLIATSDLAALKASSDVKLRTIPGARWQVCHLNEQTPPLDKKEVRQALAYAIDKDSLVRAAYQGNATPMYGPMSPVYKNVFDPAVEQYGFRFDLAKAKQKMSEAGVSGFKMPLDISVAPETSRMAEQIKAMLAQIDVDVEINGRDGNGAFDLLGKKQFTATQISWTPRPDLDGNLRRHFYSSSPLNYQSYANPKVDELLDLTRRLPNGDQRIQAFRDMQKILVDDVPWLYLVFENQTAGMLSRVQDLPPITDTLMRTKSVWLSS